MKFFLKGDWEDEYIEVTKIQYINAERNAGFFCGPGYDDTAISVFSGHSVRGKTKYEDGDIISFDGGEECM